MSIIRVAVVTFTMLALLLFNPTIGHTATWTPLPDGSDDRTASTETNEPPVQSPTPPVQSPAPPVQSLAPPVQSLAPPVQSLAPPVQSLAPPVHPPTPGPIETLYMSDGSFIRGVIKVVGSSELRRIPWDVLSISESDSPLGSDDGPRVHIQVTGRRQGLYFITLEAITGLVTTIDYDASKHKFKHRHSYITQPVCRAPCEQHVSLEATNGFMVSTLKKDASSNSKAVPSRRLELPPKGDVNLRVRPGRRGLLFGGVAIMAAGTLSVLGAAIWSRRDQPGVVTALALGGVVGLAGGISLAFMSPTKVSVEQ